MKKQVYSTLLLIFTAFIEPASASSDKIALILNYPDKEYSQTIVDFFQQTRSSIQDERSWHILHSQLITPYLQRREHQSSSLPTMNIKNLAVNLEPSQKMLPELQKLVDTLAIKGAIVAHCENTSNELISGCALYYYDRNQEKITASAKKTFSVPLSDVSRWPPQLTNSLYAGIDHKRKLHEQRTLRQFMATAKPEPRKTNLGLATQLRGEQARVPGSAIRTLPIFSLQPGLYRERNGLGLELSYGKIDKKFQQETNENLTLKSAGLAINTGATALDSILWNLSLISGYADRILSKGSQGKITDHSFFITLRPGLAWEFSDQWYFGLDFQVTNFFTLASQTKGKFENESFNRYALGSGFSVRKVF